MTPQTALVIGATGLVGHQLVLLLLQEERFSRVKIFVRRSTAIQHPKLEQHLVDFEDVKSWASLLHGQVLFSALGTTLRKAGSKAAQYKIDHTYQFTVAQAAASNGVPVYVLVSSAMASVESKFFYTRMKGELERDIKNLSFESIHILQPGMLAGHRLENRAGEKVGSALIKFLNAFGIAKNQRPIDALLVARAMINISFRKNQRVEVIRLLEVFEAAS